MFLYKSPLIPSLCNFSIKRARVILSYALRKSMKATKSLFLSLLTILSTIVFSTNIWSLVRCVFLNPI